MALSAKPVGGHAFVFSHRNLIGQNHTDVLFGADPSANPAAQIAFIGSLAANGVRYSFSGHDHVHQRSIVTSPDGKASVQQVIGASNSSKFYVPLGNVEAPGTVNNDINYNHPPRETSIVQERNTIGYYIVTVDGPSVAVDGSYRRFANVVETGWYAAENGTASSILSLSGMENELGSPRTDVYTLSMTYDPRALPHAKLTDGSFGLATRDASGNWVNAVDLNAGGSRSFVPGPWAPGYKLGTFGVDPVTQTAWAVLDYNGKFAAAQFARAGGQGPRGGGHHD